MAKMLGIDMGTAYTRVCLGKDGIVLRAPSVIALETRTKQVLAVGPDAKRMIGRTPANISAAKPIRGGIVSNIEDASLMLGALLEKSGIASSIRRPTVLSAIPFGASESERRAIEDVIFDAGASTVLLTEAPLAAAIGAGMKVMSARGAMLVDIGAGTVEVAVISHGGIIISSVIKQGGESVNTLIRRFIRDKHSILIGEVATENIKHKLATLAGTDRGSVGICGKSTKIGGVAKGIVTSGELREILVPHAEGIVKAIREALEETPPELSSDISDYGIILCGGGSLLPGLPEYLKNALGMNVTRAKDPMDCVCLGINRILTGGSEMRRFICSKAK